MANEKKAYPIIRMGERRDPGSSMANLRGAAFRRLVAGKRASGKANFPDVINGGVKRKSKFGVHGSRSAKEV